MCGSVSSQHLRFASFHHFGRSSSLTSEYFLAESLVSFSNQINRRYLMGQYKLTLYIFPCPPPLQSAYAGLCRCVCVSMGTQAAPFIFGCFFLGILFTGELWEFVSFAERYPAVIYNILLFGLTSALGQVSALMGEGLASPRETGLAGRRGWQDQL